MPTLQNFIVSVEYDGACGFLIIAELHVYVQCTCTCLAKEALIFAFFSWTEEISSYVVSV